MTRFSPTWARIAATWSSMTLPMVQSGAMPATSCRKRSSTVWPCAVCSTSGWNCTPANRRAGSSKPATGAPADVAVTVKPGGAAETASPWLIHTDCSAGRSWNSTPGSTTRRSVPPNSLSPVRSAVPPRATAIAWKP